MTPDRYVAQSLFPDIQADKAIGPILPSVFVGSNAELMRAIAPYYLTGSVLDVTYGDGAWWGKFQPDPFTHHDKFKGDGVDFTALPEPDNNFETVCFDPPYVLSGGEGTVDGFQESYGIGISRLQHNNGAKFESLLRGGLIEAARVARRFVLVKCMEFAQGGGDDGGFKNVPYLMTKWAEEVGLRSYDVIVHHTGSGPGGHNIFVPKRARRHHSYLLVFKVAS